MSVPPGAIDAAFYAEHGYCHIRPSGHGFLEDVNRAALTFGQVVETTIDDSYVRAFKNEDGKFRQLRYIHYQTDAFHRLMQSEETQAIVKCIFGTQRMYVTHSKLSYKEAGQELAWYPHQDNAYKLLHDMPPTDGITVAVFLEDADERNGTIQVFPGSHKLKTLAHSLHAGDPDDSMQLVIQALPDISPESVVAKKGDILVFGFDMIHQSPPNQSHGYRPVFLFEIKPHKGFPMDERGLPPVIINGELSRTERLGYLFATVFRRARIAVGKIPLDSRLGLSVPRQRS